MCLGTLVGAALVNGNGLAGAELCWIEYESSQHPHLHFQLSDVPVGDTYNKRRADVLLDQKLTFYCDRGYQMSQGSIEHVCGKAAWQIDHNLQEGFPTCSRKLGLITIRINR